ncbi:putative methyltransferase-like protein 25 [Sinocyclocheilus rhinocerous]|uniref:putative methyltransferase-like protein 25 n=1 Tax=Sinocyclocheilus rhinocerous TaxID=307959 RepID=UPI0007BA4C3D|nr:PREDICTED: methyltransferase-like protein 25 [Sinocyclocheilus rhinocerous]
MAFNDIPIDTLKRKIDEATRFLSISLSISNAHTVDFYTRDVWSTFMCASPEEVLCAISSTQDRMGAIEEKENTTFGFCNASKKLVDISALLRAAKAHCLPGLGVCMQLEDLMQNLRLMTRDIIEGVSSDEVLGPDEFMNCKKAHEVQAMSEVVASLAKCCRVKQVIDVGSGKGYLCSYLSMRFNLQVFGIDSSSTNTHGAHERNRKLKKFSKAYQKPDRATKKQPLDSEDGSKQHSRNFENSDGHKNFITKEKESFGAQAETSALSRQVTNDLSTSDNAAVCSLDPNDSDSGSSFLSMLSLDVIEDVSPRVHPSQLSLEDREKRKRENLERKTREWRGNDSDGSLFSPLTSYITAETELKTLITELEDAVLVGLHTCGDLAPSTLQMFKAKQELRAVCSVGCCYHLLSEEFDQDRQGCVDGVCGFPMSQYLKAQACFCGRNARMSACLALERVSAGGGLPMESLFYRAVLHVILRDHYDSFKSEKRVGNVYSKASSFVDYVRRALRKLDLDDTTLSDGDIQSYHELYSPRMNEMVAFNMLKVTLAPCIEGLILLDRLCYLKEQVTNHL